MPLVICFAALTGQSGFGDFGLPSLLSTRCFLTSFKWFLRTQGPGAACEDDRFVVSLFCRNDLGQEKRGRRKRKGQLRECFVMNSCGKACIKSRGSHYQVWEPPQTHDGLYYCSSE